MKTVTFVADRVIRPHPIMAERRRKSLPVYAQPVVLFLVFLIYVLIGAVVFRALEGPDSMAKQWKLRSDLLELIENTCINTSMLVGILEALDTERGHLANHLLIENITYPVWNFLGSTKFVMTLITTIGYGNVVAETPGGKVFCIFYAFFGIPLTIAMLHSMGEFLFYIAELIFVWFCPKKLREKKVLQAVVMQGVWVTLIWLAPGGLYVVTMGWTYLDAIYFIFITQSTIGVGDFLLTENIDTAVDLFTIVHIIFGLAWVSLIITRIANLIQSNVDSLEDSMLEMEVQRLQREVLHGLNERRKMHEAVQAFSSNLKKKGRKKSGRNSRSGLGSLPKHFPTAMLSKKHSDKKMPRTLDSATVL